MGYPMSWGRVTSRNNLLGDYDPVAGNKPTHFDPRPMIAGDMRRLEKDSRDENHLREYARVSGITPEQAKILLDAFFDTGPWYLPDYKQPVSEETSHES